MIILMSIIKLDIIVGFRLLNSEIGNDPSNIKMASEWGLRP